MKLCTGPDTCTVGETKSPQQRETIRRCGVGELGLRPSRARRNDEITIPRNPCVHRSKDKKDFKAFSLLLFLGVTTLIDGAETPRERNRRLFGVIPEPEFGLVTRITSGAIVPVRMGLSLPFIHHMYAEQRLIFNYCSNHA